MHGQYADRGEEWCNISEDLRDNQGCLIHTIVCKIKLNVFMSGQRKTQGGLSFPSIASNVFTVNPPII